MCLSVKAPTSCQQLREHKLHLDGGGWGRMLSRAQLFCSFALHSQAAIRAIPHLCIVERNSPTPVRRRLSLTHAGLGKDISDSIELKPAMNE